MNTQHTNPKYSDKVAARALELYEQDQAKWRERQALAGALSEMDVPAEYMDRAAAEVNGALADTRRRVLAGFAAICGVAFGILAVWKMTHSRADVVISSPQAFDALAASPRSPGQPEPLIVSFSAPRQMLHHVNTDEAADYIDVYAPNADPVFRHNIDTQASISYVKESHGGYAHVAVDYFAPSTTSLRTEKYWADLHTSYGNKILEGYHTVSFRARGSGLSHVRFALTVLGKQQGIADPLSLSKDWRYYTFNLHGFYHRALVDGVWRTVGSGSPEQVPDQVTNAEFYFGEQVNPITSRGQADVGDVRFQ